MSPIFKSTDTAVGNAVLVDKDTGAGITGLTDVKVKIYNPDGTVLLAALGCTELSGSQGIYGFSLASSQRAQIGIYTWEMSTATGNILKAVPGTFQSGGWVDGIKSPVGLNPVHLLVRDRTSHDPLAGVGVTIYDSSGLTMVANGLTGADGMVALDGNEDEGWSMPLGEYLVRCFKVGANFDLSYDIEVVAGSNSFTLEGTNIEPIPPPDPELCLIYGWLYEIGGTPWVEQTFRVSLYSPPPNLVNIVIGTGAWTVLTDATGYFSFNAFRGSQIRLDIPQASTEETIVLVPDQASIKLKVLLGLG